jgi:hypothetical protein
MTPENFCYWLNGFFELTGQDKELFPRQYDIIRDHLSLVFNKLTPIVAEPYDILKTPHTGEVHRPLCGTGDPLVDYPFSTSTVPHAKTYC